MAVKIRLQRFGTKKKPYYRVVATDSRNKRDGRFIEQVGTYDPMRKPHVTNFKMDRVEHWISVGAQPSDTVASLLRRHRREQAAAATEA